MIRVNDNILYISTTDLPIDGKNMERITKVIIDESREKHFGSDYGDLGLYNFPNLQYIEFPRNILSVKKRAIANCPKIKFDGLIFKNKDCVIDSAGSIIPTDVIEDAKKSKLMIFENMDSSIEEYIHTYNLFAFTMTQEEQLKYSIKLCEILEKKGYSISNIADKITNDEILTSADIQMLNIYMRKRMNLPLKPCYITLECNQIGFFDFSNGDIKLGYQTIANQKINENSIRKSNFMFMYVLCHELHHLKQMKNSDGRSLAIPKQIDYIDHSLAKVVWSSYNHDLQPDEISADLGAYNFLVNYFDEILPNNDIKNELTNIALERKKERIKKGYCIDDQDRVIREDYRLSSMDELLSSSKITDEKKQIIEDLKKMYLGIKKACTKLGIDLYKYDIDFYYSNETKNKSK